MNDRSHPTHRFAHADRRPARRLSPARTAALGALILAAACLTPALAAGAVPPAEFHARGSDHGWTARCGSQPEKGAGWYRVRAFNVGCVRARSVAHEWTWKGQATRVQRFRCSSKDVGYEVVQVDCRRNPDGTHKHIRFLVGA